MSEKNVIEVPLPEPCELTSEDLEAVRAAVRVLVDVPINRVRGWEEKLELLRAEGWTVRRELVWHVEARRGKDFEEACGRTRKEAYAALFDATRMDVVEGCT